MLIGVSATRADEVKVELKDLPKAVLETVMKRFPKAELVEAAKEIDGTKVEFEVTLKVGETKYDVMLTPDGKITLIEKTIALKDLPKAVAEAVEKAYPKATLTLAEEMTKVVEGKEVLSYYEVQLTTADKKMLEVEVSPEGKILMTEDKSKEKK
jgi:antitoxin component of MazEF toxin-antitoxin module